ncbi:methyl-accepting chemotaxis protein [Demequina mangrovi]|uniref:Methyl-accepting chemotaxis protein n=1 Tax=Demequina mangrovi TaxID=1043493 RepID=A0A1H6ZCK7_9MICO|nr:methyl-accepting chemotaxis protein [Demequina mangrovi]SEJ51078.1 methyl-accepting chemotaxis protein [Demequina mangrovi]
MFATISRKVALLSAVLLAGTVLVGVIAVQRVDAVAGHLHTVNEVNAVKQRYAINFRGSVHDRAIAVRDVVLAGSASEIDAEVALIESLAADYSAAEQDMAAIVAEAGVSSAESAALEDIEAIQAQTLPLVDQVVTLARAGDVDGAATVLASEAKPAFVEWLRTINVFIDLEEELSGAETAAADGIVGGFRSLMIGVIALAALASGALAWTVARSITRPVNRAVSALESVADGDLTVRIDAKGDGEVGRMARAMNAALDSMSEVFAAVTTSAGRLRDASSRMGGISDEVAGAAGDSMSRAEGVDRSARDVSASIQTVASGAEQMGASIQEIGDGASRTARVSTQAVASVESAAATVAELGEASRAISEVVTLIGRIAEQTNLLALNATIEAARAGEAGKGFAVVASEVKDLSQETANATQDITRRVEAIQAGTDEAVEAIRRMTDVIGEVNQYAQTIASAVEEQSSTTAEMTRSATDVATSSTAIVDSAVHVLEAARGTLASASSSQEESAALAALADELAALVAPFRTSASV